MTKVIVTGGSGKLGRAVLKDLVANGYEVLNIDQVAPREIAWSGLPSSLMGRPSRTFTSRPHPAVQPAQVDA